MGDFYEAVSALLDAFARGVAVIRAQRSRRKKEQMSIDSAQKIAEKSLSSSLRKNRAEINQAYGRDLKRFGTGFASGDAEAQSSLSSILFRLNAGFVAVIERFTRGHSTQTDYQALMRLSNDSRLDAIQTFERLSKRLSRSSLALAPQDKHSRSSHRRKSKHGSTFGRLDHSRSKSAPSLSITSSGWVRPKKHGRRTSSSSTKTSGSSSPQSLTLKGPLSNPRRSRAQQPPNPPLHPSPPPLRTSDPRLGPENRKSIMSFASDSTKLGEIPEHKWARSSVPREAFFPVNPYPEPEKQRSRFLRFFKIQF